VALPRRDNNERVVTLGTQKKHILKEGSSTAGVAGDDEKREEGICYDNEPGSPGPRIARTNFEGVGGEVERNNLTPKDERILRSRDKPPMGRRRQRIRLRCTDRFVAGKRSAIR